MVRDIHAVLRSYRKRRNRFLQILSESALLANGAMGSYLFELTGRLSEQNHVYEAFKVDRLELVLQVHLEHRNARARTILANTLAPIRLIWPSLANRGASKRSIDRVCCLHARR